MLPRPALSAAILATVAACSPGTSTAQLAPPIEALVPVTPRPVRGGNATHLTYELHVTNLGRRPLSLGTVTVSTPGLQAHLARFEADELGGMIRRPGLAPRAEHPERIDGGMRAIIFVWITLPSNDVPDTVTHRIALMDEDNSVTVLDAPHVAIGAPAIAIGPPLRGDNWFAANGPDNATGHRRAMLPIDGRTWTAQRFAIDWVQVESDSTYSGNPDDNANYYAWGEEALAVADGIVTATKDGIPENVPGPDSRAVPITLETIGGNYVIVDIGEGHYAFYAHLRPGSLRVAVGDRVERGAVLGVVGNSGNSTEPHLHFHLSNRNSPLASEGLPYTIDEFHVLGASAGFGNPFNVLATPEHREHQIPMANELVRFPAEAEAR